jgi:hypothetical protein
MGGTRAKVDVDKLSGLWPGRDQVRWDVVVNLGGGGGIILVKLGLGQLDRLPNSLTFVVLEIRGWRYDDIFSPRELWRVGTELLQNLNRQ